MSNLRDKIYAAVQQIPRGKAATYGMIAKIVNTNPRVVGNALHKNPDPSAIPCHRVVNRKGELSKNFAFGGLEGQKAKLENEGVLVNHKKIPDRYFTSI